MTRAAVVVLALLVGVGPVTAQDAPQGTTAPVAALTPLEQADVAAAKALEALARHEGAALKEWERFVLAQSKVQAAADAHQKALQALPSWKAYAERRRAVEASLKARGLALDWLTVTVKPGKR